MADRKMTAKDACKILNVSRMTLYRRRQEAKIARK
jgi:predicted site-specific integrase-resolvase